MKFTIEPALTSHAMNAMSRHEQGRARRQRAEAGRVAAGDLAQRRADQQRDGGGDRDGRVPRAAEQPEDQPGEQARVQPRLRRQVGQRRVADARRQQVRRQRDAGDEVAAQPAALVRPQPRQRGHPAPHDVGAVRTVALMAVVVIDSQYFSATNFLPFSVA